MFYSPRVSSLENCSVNCICMQLSMCLKAFNVSVMISVSFCLHLFILELFFAPATANILSSNQIRTFHRPIRFVIRFCACSLTWLLDRITKSRLSCSRNILPNHKSSNSHNKHQLQKFNRHICRNSQPRNCRQLSANRARLPQYPFKFP